MEWSRPRYGATKTLRGRDNLKLIFNVLCYISAISLLLLSGCASTPKPTIAKVSIVTQSDLNPDSRNRPSPVVVKWYELKSDSEFNRADFFSVFDNEQKALGSDLLNSEIFQLRPGETLKLERPIQPDARYVVVVAAFRDLEHSQWRGVLPIPSKNKFERIIIQLERNKIMISGEQKCLLWCGSPSPESFNASSVYELRAQTKTDCKYSACTP